MGCRNRVSSKTGRFALLTGMLLAGLAIRASAADPETRSYAVLVDGNPAGNSQMSIRANDDGSVIVSSQADIQVKTSLLTMYSYSYRGTETWKNGRLQRLETKANDNGDRFVVVAAAETKGLRVKVNGREFLASSEVWTTSYWHLADARLRNRALSLLEPDSGKLLAGKLEMVEHARINVGGKPVSCVHYRVSGEAQAELWFDEQERLVRQEWLEDGHRTVLQLLTIQR
jgi:hypothetical protein